MKIFVVTLAPMCSGMRRVAQPQQPMPPSGPMMRPQQQQQLHGGGGNMYLGNPHLQHRMAGAAPPQGAANTPGGYAMPPQAAPGYARNTQRSPNVSIGEWGSAVLVRS